METKSIQLKLPGEVNKILKMGALKNNLTLADYCVKLLCESAKKENK